MIFFDRNSVIDQTERRLQLAKLRQKDRFYADKIAEVNKQKAELMSSPENMEKFAREKYFMKKDNEDVYIINTHTDSNDK
jgi:cell division protein FtsB